MRDNALLYPLILTLAFLNLVLQNKYIKRQLATLVTSLSLKVCERRPGRPESAKLAERWGVAEVWGNDSIEELFDAIPHLKRLKATGDCLPSGLLDALPKSVDQLDVELTSHDLDSSRENFDLFLRNQCKALQKANNGIPQEVKATFRILESVSGANAKRLMRSLTQGKYKSAARLKATVD